MQCIHYTPSVFEEKMATVTSYFNKRKTINAKERRIYTITNFMVNENKQKFVVVQKNALMLHFYATTTLKEVANDDTRVAHYIFEFVNFEHLRNIFGKEVLRGNEVKVIIWDEYVSLFEQKIKESETEAPTPKVFILTSTIVKEFRELHHYLLSGGRTTHSRFQIPLDLFEDSTGSIKQNTQLAQLIIQTDLIIWDEAPMTKRLTFEALDRTLNDTVGYRNLDKTQKPFRGKATRFEGDFR
ncbi:hypothetical protein OROGR_022969 [Orobanche gracilis]